MRYVALTEIDNDILIQGDGCCTNLQELYQALVEHNTTEILITKEFANEYFTYSALCDFVENSAALVPHVRIVVEDTVYDSMSEAVKELHTFKAPEEFIYALEQNPSRIIGTINSLCDFYFNAHDESTIANNKLATMLIKLEELNKQLTFKNKDYDKLMVNRNELYSKLHALVERINFRYEKTVDVDNMFQLEHNAYNHILYIKEITRVHYTDTLIYYLQEILKTLYSAPVRLVVIEPYYAYSRKDLYPGTAPHWDLSYNDVYANNIFMAGFQPKVMTDVLKDPNHVNYLIILDRGGYMAPHVVGGNVTTVYTVSDLKDAPNTIQNNHLISYDSSTLYIPYIENFDDLSPEDKVQKYSSMNITKELIRHLEEVK